MILHPIPAFSDNYIWVLHDSQRALIVDPGEADGVLHWLRLNDGAFAARSKMGDAIVGRPVVADGILVVQSRDGKLAAFALQ